LLLFNQFFGKINNIMDGAFAGGTLAFGFVTFWMSPEVIPIPFVNFFLKLQDSYLFADLNRPTLQAGQLWLTLVAVAAGVLLGTAFAFRSKIWPVLTSVLIGSLGFAMLIPGLPGIPKTPSESAVTTTIQPETIPIQDSMSNTPGWKENSLAKTIYFVSTPTNWLNNPKNSQINYPINLISADDGALFSIRLLDGEKDPVKTANDDIHINKTVFDDFQVLSPPVFESNESFKWVWTEGYSQKGSSYITYSYITVPEGILEFSMLSAESGYTDRKLIFKQIVNSLHRK
jgi:hypothetical protein